MLRLRCCFEFKSLIESDMKKILYLYFLLASPGLTWAACTTSAGGSNPITYHLSGFNPPTFDPSIDEGAVIHSAKVIMSSVGGQVNCYPNIGVVVHHGTTGGVGAYSTYPTGISGVGIRFRTAIGSSVKSWWPYYEASLAGSVGYVNNTATIEVELVKTGVITSGGKLFGEVGAWSAQGGVSKIVSIVVDGAINIVPMVPTCKIIPPASVPLGNISVSKFTNVGVGTALIPFNIKLNCSGGAPNVRRNIFITFSDQTAPTNRTDVLSLVSGSTAKGIGIQVYSGSSVIKYGADSSTPGNPNQWFAGSAGNGELDIPLTARYIQVAPKVTPGSANGRATFTMSYQ